MAETAAPYIGFARKWRPRSFDELVGQGHVARALSAEVDTGRIGHAYLFAGPRGVGKTSAARILAKAVNCEAGPTSTPCGECAHCRAIPAGTELDVIEIDGASNNGVEQVRDLREGVHHVPFACRYKVYIIDEVHMLSIAAFNALLKTLEEPPSFVVFIFATTETEKIPDTIKSRCQVFGFREIGVEDIVGRLDYILTQEKAEVAEEERQAILETIALSAEGGMRDAQVALDQCISLAEGPLVLEDVRAFLGVADQAALFSLVENIRDGQSAPLLETVSDLANRGRDLERFSKQTLAFLRDLMVLRFGGGDNLVRFGGDSLARARTLAGELDPALLINAINIFLDMEMRVKQGAPARTMLEFALIRLTALEGLRPIAEAIQHLEGGAGTSSSSPAPSGRGAPVRSAPNAQGPAASAPPAVTKISQSGPSPEPIPLQSGGSLEPVGAGEVDKLRAMISETFRNTDFSLSRALSLIPLDRIEGATAYFGKPGHTISRYDAQVIDKPDNKKRLSEELARLAGKKELRILVQGKIGAVDLVVPVVPVAPAAVAAPPGPSGAEAPIQRAEDIPLGAEEPQEYEEPFEPPVAAPEPAAAPAGNGADELSAEEQRNLFGYRGLSAERIRQLLEESDTLRAKIDLAQKIFGGAIVDGDGNPIQT